MTRKELEDLLRSHERQLLLEFSVQIASDGPIRKEYAASIKRASQEILSRVDRRLITVDAGAAEAHKLRGMALEAMRGKTSPLMRAVAIGMKEKNPTFNALIANKTEKLFGEKANFYKLTKSDKNRVYREVILSAGRDNPNITRLMKFAAPAARAFFVLSLAATIYTVYTAENKNEALVAESSSFIGGLAGATAGAALVAGVACTATAPVCVTLAVFVTGGMTIVGSWMGREFGEEIYAGESEGLK